MVGAKVTNDSLRRTTPVAQEQRTRLRLRLRPSFAWPQPEKEEVSVRSAEGGIDETLDVQTFLWAS